MRISIVSTMYGAVWSGSEELWAKMADAAIDRGDQVLISVFAPQAKAERLSALRARGATVTTRPLHRFGKVTGALGVLRRAFEPIFRFRPDVILISQGNTFDLAAYGHVRPLRNMLARHGIPYVVVCQLNNDVDVLSDTVRRKAQQYLGAAAAVGFVSDGNRRSATRQLAQDLPNATVVRNPVNLRDRSLIAWPTATAARFAMVGRLATAQKGHDLAFAALSMPPWRRRDWTLSLYGSGGDEAYLKELAHHYGIASRVEFKGHVGDIRQVWADNHLMLLPSRFEGTPLSLVEAMCCGRPAVVTDVGGNAEWVREPHEGFVADGFTVSSIANALERAWAARDQWERMGRRAHETAVAQFDDDAGATLLKLMMGSVRTSRPGRQADPAR